MALSEKLEMLLSANASQGISELQRFSGEADKNLTATESKFKQFSSSVSKLGAGGLGIGGLLTSLGSAEQAASQQLEAAIGAAGQSVDEFQGRIDSTISKMEGFDHSAVDTQNALQKLVGAYGDTNTALDEMQLVADLAAAKHESLAEAADQVAKVHGGATRILKAYDIQVQTNADGTKDYDGALTELSRKLEGQASAASDTFMGHVKALGIEIEDDVAKFGEQWGPAILGVSGILTAVGPVVSGTATVIDKLKVAHAGAAVTAEAQAAAEGELEVVQGGLLASAGALVTTLAPYAAGVGIAAGVLSAFLDVSDENTRATDAFAAALENQTGTMQDNVNAVIAKQLASSDIATLASQAGVSFQAQGQAVRDNSDDYEKYLSILGRVNTNQPLVGQQARDVASALEHAGASATPFGRGLIDAANSGKLSGQDMSKLVLEVQGLSNGYVDGKTNAANFKAAQDGVGGSVSSSTAFLSLLNDETKDYKKATDEASKAVDGFSSFVDQLATAQGKQYDSSLSALKGSIGYEQSIDDLTKTLMENAGSLDVHEEAGRKDLGSLITAGDAIKTLIIQRFQETHSVQAATDAGNLYVANLENQLKAAGYNEDQIGQMIDTINLTPDKIQTLFSNNAVEQQIVIGKYLQNLKDIPPALQTKIEAALDSGSVDEANWLLTNFVNNPRQVDISVNLVQGQVLIPDLGAGANLDFHGVVVPQKAMGGDVSYGSSYLVGERGPELFTPGASGWITPADATRAALNGGSSSPSVQVSITGVVPDSIAEAASRGTKRGLILARRD